MQKESMGYAINVMIQYNVKFNMISCLETFKTQIDVNFNL